MLGVLLLGLTLVDVCFGYVRASEEYRVSLDQGWSFGRTTNGTTEDLETGIILPHTVTKLSWHKWNPLSWEHIFVYEKQFTVPSDWTAQNLRIFLHFDRVMVIATTTLNGHSLGRHLGGYLPFQYEITHLVTQGNNTLSVVVDSRWSYVPPEGNPRGTSSIDYFCPGGITGSVKLYAFPAVFLADVFAKPVNVLIPNDRSIAIQCTIDAALVPPGAVQLAVTLYDASHREVTTLIQPVQIQKVGIVISNFTVTANLHDITLWDVDNPYLYTLKVTSTVTGPSGVILQNNITTRIGFREAHFEVNGFFLNGRRLRIFGLNRHELYAYVGMSMPPRVMYRDAEILKKQFNVNMVRCSHYPQTETFLDACDELGIMVWEETPGWGYLGNSTWKDIVVQNVHDMIIRDRNHPSIIIWGVRVNESPNDPALYNKTTELSRILDGSRPASGSMTSTSNATLKNWHEDVFAYDDYHTAPDGTVAITRPLPGLPFMLSEMIGQWSYGLHKSGFHNIYRRDGDLEIQMLQAVFHAQGHNNAAAYPRMCGAIAWCGYEYPSPGNSYQGIKYPGVADVFRIPKLGATVYQAQVSPSVRPVIAASFYWDFGKNSLSGPGKDAAIFSNCEKLHVYIGNKLACQVLPDKRKYAHLEYPPSFCDLTVPDGNKTKPELRIDGFVGSSVVLSQKYSSDPAQDKFDFTVDDIALLPDGADATRLVFRILDRYNQPRAFAGGSVKFSLTGPGILVGDNPYDLALSGGAGAVYVKSTIATGTITVTATHSVYGSKSIGIKVEG